MTRRPITLPVLAALFVVAGSPVLHACPICFQIEDGASASSVRAAVFVLVGVTTGVLTCCGVFVARFAQRAARQPIDPGPPERRDE